MTHRPIAQGLRSVAVLALALVMSACSLPTLAPDAPPAWSGETQILKRRLTMVPLDRSNAEQTLLSVTRLSAEGLQTVVVTPSGQRLMTLVRDEDGPRYTQTLMKAPPFPAAWFIQRLEWSLRPAETLGKAFEGSDWRLEVEHFEHGPVRRIHQGEALRARLDTFRETGEITRQVLTDFQFGYRLTITPLGDEAPDAHRGTE